MSFKNYKDYGNKYNTVNNSTTENKPEPSVINKDVTIDIKPEPAVINKDNNVEIKQEPAVIKKEPKVEPVTVQNYIKWEYGKVFNCVKLNVRKAPTKTAEIITVIKLNDTVKYSYTEDKDWYKIDNENGVIGYCMSEFIKSEN